MKRKIIHMNAYLSNLYGRLQHFKLIKCIYIYIYGRFVNLYTFIFF